MAGVNVLSANPMRKCDGLREIIQLHRVLEATNDPLLNGKVVIHLESIKVSTPHGTGRMISPPDLGSRISLKLESTVNKLHGF
jgi:hypothetical protein